MDVLKIFMGHFYVTTAQREVGTILLYISTTQVGGWTLCIFHQRKGSTCCIGTGGLIWMTYTGYLLRKG